MSPTSPQARLFQSLVALAEIQLEGMDDLPELTTATFIGIVVAITGNVLISLALNLQKLAHKRIEAKFLARQKPPRQNGKNDDDSSPNGRRERERRHAQGPSLDENDEDHLRTHPEESSQNDNHPAGTQSLFPFPDTSSTIQDYGAISHNQQTSSGPPRSTYKDPLLSQGSSLLPVDIVSEDSALNNQGPKRKLHPEPLDATVEGNETAYLRSKLWYVSPPGTYILSLLRL